MSNEQEGSREHILALLIKLRDGTASRDEINEIDHWYDQSITEKKYVDGLSDTEKLQAKDRIFQNINAQISRKTSSVPTLIPWRLLKTLSIAATLLFFFGAGLIYWMHPGKETIIVHKVWSNVRPGGSKAVLTLSSGKQIILNDAKNGVLTSEGDAVISKSDNTKISYKSGTTPNNKIEYNTMATLRGGEYHLVLADGTNVWLNAASQIKYPTSFTGKERVVEMSGEAYFEVSHNASKPFKVITNEQTIEVLGTHFNVNAYGNELQSITTLLQGSVRISAYGLKKVLKPNQQAAVSRDEMAVTDVNTQEAISWKEGYFEFTDADIQTIMRQLERWYDVEVIFEGKIPSETFTGRVSKFLDLRQVLTLIKSPKIHIAMNGRRIMIKE